MDFLYSVYQLCGWTVTILTLKSCRNVYYKWGGNTFVIFTILANGNAPMVVFFDQRFAEELRCASVQDEISKLYWVTVFNRVHSEEFLRNKVNTLHSDCPSYATACFNREKFSNSR